MNRQPDYALNKYNGNYMTRPVRVPKSPGYAPIKKTKPILPDHKNGKKGK